MVAEAKRAELKIYGKVQGVFFRASTREQARARGLGGWVENKADGTVEAVVEGPREEVEELVDWAHDGPSSAEVERVEVEWKAASGDHTTFEVRR